MNALKKRPVAIFLTAVIVILAVMGGSHRSLAVQREKAAALYETGTGADGSVKEDQERQMEICSNLAVVAERYLEGEPALDSLRENLERWQAAAEDEKPAACAAARADADELLGTLMLMSSLTEQDAHYVSSFQSQLASYDYTIARNGYNAAARAFNEDVLGVFPANVLGPLTGIRPLEVYE